MKLITSVLILALTGTALAQAPAQKHTAAPAVTAKNKSVAPAAKPPVKGFTAAAKPAQAAAKPGVKPAQKKKVAAKSVKPAKPVAKKEATPTKPTADSDKKQAEVKVDTKNRRDPFVSVVMSREGPPCAGGGKKCIAIDQVTLQGVVRAPSGPIAVVSSGAKKTFFLRENDPVYNGVVVKISPDSIIFRETVMDRLGKTSQREVVKRIQNTPAA